MVKAEKRTIYIYIYYVVLLLLFYMRQDTSADPPVIFRLAYMAAVIIPSIVYKGELSYPTVLILFYCITIGGFTYSFMPYSLPLYVIITIIVTALFYSNNKKNKVPVFLWFTAIYIFLIDMVFRVGGNGAPLFENNLYCFVLIGCFLLIDGNNDSSVQLLPLCFAIITIMLSGLFLTHREQFIFDRIGNMERSGWTDPNYFGMILGMGTIVSVLRMFATDWKSQNNIKKIIYISAIVLSVPTLLLNASRGALLSVIVSFLVLIFFSKSKPGVKILVGIVAVIAILYLYNNQYFDLLEYRMFEDTDVTGSERTIIWREKLTAYANNNPLYMIFGYGLVNGTDLGGRHVGFHNDFIGFLVCYGIVGLLSLLYLLYYPIRKTSRNSDDRIAVIVLIVYLAVCSLTLEPFLVGSFPFYSFYMYALLMSKQKKN